MKLREKIKWADPITVGFLCLIIAFVGFIAYLKTEKNNYLLISILSSMIFVLKGIQILNGEGILIENKYNGEVKIKPETSCDITNDFQLPIAIDGIKTDKYQDEVFKVRSGTNVYIDENGYVKSYSPIAASLNKSVNRNYFKKEDLNCWISLF